MLNDCMCQSNGRIPRISHGFVCRYASYTHVGQGFAGIGFKLELAFDVSGKQYRTAMLVNPKNIAQKTQS